MASRYIGMGNDLTHRAQHPMPGYRRQNLAPDEFTEPPEVMVNTHPPVWNQPSFGSLAFDKETSFINIPFYETPYTLFTYQTEAATLARITGISYEVTCQTQYSVFVWSVYRSGDMLSSWEDCLVNPAAQNPANRWALAGHVRPIPYYGRLDRNDLISVTVTAKGVEPFTHTNADLAMCAARVCLTGWLSKVEDERDSKSRAAEFGDLSSFPTANDGLDPDPLRYLPKEVRDLWSGKRK